MRCEYQAPIDRCHFRIGAKDLEVPQVPAINIDQRYFGRIAAIGILAIIWKTLIARIVPPFGGRSGRSKRAYGNQALIFFLFPPPPPPPPNGCPLLINVFRCADGGPTLETSAIYSPKGLAHQPDQLLVGNPEFLPTDDMYSFQPQFVHPAQHKVRG